MGREELHKMSPQEWEEAERIIRERTGKSKDKSKL